MRPAYGVFAVSSFALGGWMALDPIGFWAAFGLTTSDPVVPGIYGGAICGEAVLCTLGFVRPLRYLPILQYMIAYKAVVCATLIPRLLEMPEAPLAGWLVVVAWGAVGLFCIWLIPWGRSDEVARAIADEGV